MHPLVSEAPWWGGPVIAAVSALVGAGVTLLFTQRRTDQRRWDDLILETAVEVETICYEMAALRRRGWPQYIDDHQARVERWVELANQLNEKQAKFRLVASVQLKDAALKLFSTAMDEFTNNSGPEPVKEFEAARKVFVSAVRQELRAN